jgi:hypothetical protein
VGWEGKKKIIKIKVEKKIRLYGLDGNAVTFYMISTERRRRYVCSNDFFFPVTNCIHNK